MTISVGASSVWEQLADCLDPMLDWPRSQANIVARRFTTSREDEYFIVKNPAERTYVRLAPDEHFLLGLMDGSRQVKDLVLAYFQQYRRLAPRRVLHLVAELRHHRFLAEPRRDVWEDLSARLRRRSWEGWLDAAARGFTNREIAISGIDKAVTSIHRTVGWVLFTRIGAISLLLLGGLGFVLFLRELLFADRGPFTMGGAGLGAVTVIALSLLLLCIHEMGHALAVKSYGREVNRGGFIMYYGLPAFFVDTTDIWMEPRGPRMVVSVGGPLVTWAAGGLAMLYVVLAPESFWVQIAYQLALIAFINNTLNVMPLLELDGYYLLMDWLELPMLRARALAFVRHDLIGKLRRRDKLSREERIFAIYGTLAFAGAVSILTLVIFVWLARGRAMAVQILETQSRPVAVLIALVLAVLAVPLILGAGAKLRRLRRRGSLIDYLRAWPAANKAQLRLDGREVLERQRFLQLLEPREREMILQQLKPRQFRPGAYVVHEGDRGDEFFLISSGRAEVVRLEAGWQRQLVILGRGDSFGELALLDDRPRQASVRALTALKVFVIGRAEFQSIIAPQLRRYGLTRQRLDERAELARVAIFHGSAAADLDPILDRLVSEEAEAGSDIIRQGEAGDRFYIVRRGSLEVLRTDASGLEERIAELGPGDYFGEMALIDDAPRSATIRTRGAVTLWWLDRASFLEAVMAQGQLGKRIKAEASHRRAASGRLAGTETG